MTCLIALDFIRGFKNPYMGILTYVIAPAFLVSGLLIICGGHSGSGIDGGGCTRPTSLSFRGLT